MGRCAQCRPPRTFYSLLSPHVPVRPLETGHLVVVHTQQVRRPSLGAEVHEYSAGEVLRCLDLPQLRLIWLVGLSNSHLLPVYMSVCQWGGEVVVVSVSCVRWLWLRLWLELHPY